MSVEQLKAARERLKGQVARNEWDSVDDFIKVIQAMRECKWTWAYNTPCKYVELRVDMRDGGCTIKNREGERISPEELAWQFSFPDSATPTQE